MVIYFLPSEDIIYSYARFCRHNLTNAVMIFNKPYSVEMTSDIFADMHGNNSSLHVMFITQKGYLSNLK